ncbi:protein kilB [Streptomyces sp. NPDC088170]|uniref:protein kilB n=1 Tax=Streptomyces sp. NPDC088170 TaxID=3365834 RepID=UPI00381FE9DF
MLSTVIAVAGTLLGAVVAGLIQSRAARAARAATRTDQRHADELAAMAAFSAAIAAHRRAMAVREDLRLTGADPDRVAAARSESHQTRAAIEEPKVRLAILAPDLARAAEDAAQATYALRGAPDPDTLTARREAAIEAGHRFVTAAARRFA